MGRRTLEITELSTTRLELLRKGFLNINDICRFVPCGRNTASKIYNSIRQKVKKEGMENCNNIILTKRLLDHLGKTADEIVKDAKQELSLKKDA